MSAELAGVFEARAEEHREQMVREIDKLVQRLTGLRRMIDMGIELGPDHPVGIASRAIELERALVLRETARENAALARKAAS